MKTYSFAAHVTKIEARFLSHILIIPQEIIEDINQKGRLRVEGTMNGAPFALAIQNLKTGERYFSMSNALRRAAKVQLNEPVKVEFHLVDPNKLDIPEELEAVLAEDPEGKAVFDEMTIGTKRGLVHYITSVKNIDSRVKRALEIIGKAKTGGLYAQKKEN